MAQLNESIVAYLQALSAAGGLSEDAAEIIVGTMNATWLEIMPHTLPGFQSRRSASRRPLAPLARLACLLA